MRKVFIVDRGRADIYASLRRALESEGDVLVIYDRRSGRPRARGGRRSPWTASGLGLDRGDRRRRTDVDDEIRERGFGVVHLDRYDADSDAAGGYAAGGYAEDDRVEDFDAEPLDPPDDD